MSAHGARLAWTLWALSSMLVFGSVLLLSVNLTASGATGLGYWPNNAVAALALSTVGALVASRRRENIIGWLFGVAGLLYGMTVFAGEYGVYALLTDPGSLPGGIVAVWIGSWLWIPSGSLVVFSFLVFPDGRLPSPRWRFVALLAGLAVCSLTASSALMPGTLEGSSGSGNPFGLGGGAGFLDVVRTVSTPLVGATALTSVAAVFLRFRQAEGDARQQLKWVAYAVVVLAVAVAASSFSAAVDRSLFGRMLFLVGFLSIPITFGVAILRYRLWDVDLVINRTLVYGALTVTLALVYLAVVVSMQYAFRVVTGEGSQLVIVASTLGIAALFNPLRRRIQGFVDRLFYRRRYDAAKTLGNFSARLRDETDLDALADDLVTVVRQTMQPERVSLWLRRSKDGGKPGG